MVTFRTLPMALVGQSRRVSAVVRAVWGVTGREWFFSAILETVAG